MAREDKWRPPTIAQLAILARMEEHAATESTRIHATVQLVGWAVPARLLVLVANVAAITRVNDSEGSADLLAAHSSVNAIGVQRRVRAV